MNTTNLFVELLVIGISAAIWCLLLALAFVEINETFLTQLQTKHEFLLTLLALPFIYVLGIVTDRLADIVFSRETTRLGKEIYSDKKETLADKVVIYKTASPLVDMINYGRSRMRICRGWLFNLPLILVTLNIYLGCHDYTLKSFILANLSLVVIWLAFYLAWRDLIVKEYEKLQRISAILRKTPIKNVKSK